MRRVVPALLLAGVLGLTPVRPFAIFGAQSPALSAPNTRAWIEERPQIEAYIKTAAVVRREDTGVGVTRPQRAFLAPGGLVESITWKPIAPGKYKGFFESYLSEIAAYELDKFLDLGMVPPTVEREIDGAKGAAVMWVPETKSFKQAGGVPKPPSHEAYRWNAQLRRAKMFDDLIGNIDPNLGNWLFDARWNIVLIDHSRCFVREGKLPHKLDRVDAGLWDRMTALDEGTLAGVLKGLVDAPGIGAILERRDAMKSEIDKLVKRQGEAAVFVR